jgi:hypothetical protein
MNNAKSADYLRMATNTCKRLQALNSDAYSRCLYALSFHPFTELADIQNLKKCVTRHTVNVSCRVVGRVVVSCVRIQHTHGY